MARLRVNSRGRFEIHGGIDPPDGVTSGDELDDDTRQRSRRSSKHCGRRGWQ